MMFTTWLRGWRSAQRNWCEIVDFIVIASSIGGTILACDTSFFLGSAVWFSCSAFFFSFVGWQSPSECCAFFCARSAYLLMRVKYLIKRPFRTHTLCTLLLFILFLYTYITRAWLFCRLLLWVRFNLHQKSRDWVLNQVRSTWKQSTCLARKNTQNNAD